TRAGLRDVWEGKVDACARASKRAGALRRVQRRVLSNKVQRLRDRSPFTSRLPPCLPPPRSTPASTLHKRSVVVATLDADGTTVAHRTLPARAGSLALYFADLPAVPGGEHRAVAEATTGWYWVKDALAPLGVDLRLAHAKGVKAITGAKVKTDAHDARTLAQLLRVDLLPEAHVISDELRPLRDVLRTRLTLVERRVRALNS